MKSQVYEYIRDYAKKLSELEYGLGDCPGILVRGKGYCYATLPGADFADLKEDDIAIYIDGKKSCRDGEFCCEAEYLMGQKEMNALIVSDTPYCRKARLAGEVITAALDDMAQIVGHKVITVKHSGKGLRRGLGLATACFVRAGGCAGADSSGNKASGIYGAEGSGSVTAGSGYTVCAGRNLYEAMVAMEVLEKSAEVWMKASVVGGPRAIPAGEAKIMRLVYKKKYSKAEESSKSETEVETL